MPDQSSSIFSLQVLRRNNKEIKLFAEYIQKFVLEVDKKEIKAEIEKVKSRFHIDHCWIMRNDQKIGIVKIIRNNYYNLGLPPELNEEEINQIFEVIENDIAGFHSYRLEGSLHSKYVEQAMSRNYKITFSRKKMELNLDQVSNTLEYQDLIIKPYSKKMQQNLAEVFIDAYSDSVDEKVGMFDRSIAHSAIRSIMDGEFGDFMPELSGLLYSRDGESLIGGILITALEGCPFVVIIGIIRDIQHTTMGRRLMCWSIDKAKDYDHNKMRLWVTVENKVASSLYESLGFKEVLSISSMTKLLG
ncbi:MAG: GNAT family N-acetyltransferase [Candidatus Heimdallarchaeota archaeon]|nr:GNAT family N-acetyltransferase [Candidatus Heimdallarchaeota archaeon]